MKAPSEAQLIAAAQAGDSAAFTLLTTPHYGKVSAWLQATVGGLRGEREIADRIEQQAFDDAQQGIANFDGRSTFKTWLYTIAKYIAWPDAAKRRRLKIEYEQDDDPRQMENAEDKARTAEEKIDARAFKAEPRRYWLGDPAKILVCKQRGTLRRAARDRLSRDVRAVYTRRLGEMAYPDIARELGITESAARQRFHEAQQRVVAHVQRHEQPQGKYRPELRGVFK